MRAAFLLILATLFLTGCTPTPVADNSSPPEKSTNAGLEKETPPGEPVKEETPEERAKRITAEAASTYDTLVEEFSAATKKWSQSRTSFNSKEEFDAWNAKNPASEFGDKFAELAKKYADTPTAAMALDYLIKRLDGPAKAAAVKDRLLTAAETPDSETSLQIFEQVMKYGKGEPRVQAMQFLLTNAEKNLDDPKGVALLTKLIKTTGDTAPKTKAISTLMGLVEKDVQSAESVQHLSMITNFGGSKAKEQALNKLIEHHIDNDEMLNVIKLLGRQMPNSYVEKAFQKISKQATGKVKHTATVDYAKYIGFRNMYRGFVSSAEEEDLKMLDPDVVDYLRTDPDPKEESRLEAQLAEYVSDNEELLKQAKRRLFAMQNIGIGKEAPEISGTDLDGESFKLSDYRGKVVLIDFWGDW